MLPPCLIRGRCFGHHIVLNYIDSNGVHHKLQGTPEQKFEHSAEKFAAFLREEILSDGANNRDSPFQRLKADSKESKDSSVSLDQPHTMVAEGDDLSSRWALMQDFADEVNSVGYEYRPISQNSNSFAGGALQRAGFFGPGTEFPERFDSQLVFDPASGGTKSFYVPGFERPLTNPLSDAATMPLSLGAPAAPDRPDSFGDRFGNWGAAPAGGSGDTDSPVLRELQKYKRSAAPDGAVSTPAQGLPLAIPAFQPDIAGKGAVRVPGTAPVKAAPASGPLLPGTVAPNLPSEESAFGDRSKNGPGGPRPDTHPRLRSRTLSSTFPNITLRNPSQLMPSAEPGPPPGIFSGKPMSPWPLPSQVWGLANNSDASGNGDWINLLSGIVPQNPTQPAPPLDDQLRGFYRDDPVQPWFVRRQR